MKLRDIMILETKLCWDIVIITVTALQTMHNNTLLQLCIRFTLLL